MNSSGTRDYLTPGTWSLSIPAAAAWFSSSSVPPPHVRLSTPCQLRKPAIRNSTRLCAFNAASRSVSELVEEEDVLQMFLKDREENGDFISRVSDRLLENSIDSVNDDESGFLKLKPTQEWIVGETDTAPMNKKALAKIKRELMYLSIVIGTGRSGYCLVALSAQAAVSYAVVVLFRLVQYVNRYRKGRPRHSNLLILQCYLVVHSHNPNQICFQCSCLYLQLLYGYADGVSREAVPNIFLKKKSKK
ncbi:unnamed protein product [Cochlearia groenlandica]